MTLWWCCLAVSCLLVGNYLNSWRNNLGRVSLQKIPKKDYWYKLKTDYWYYWSTAGVDSLHHIQNRILWMHDPKRFFTTDAKRVNTVGGNSPTAIRTDACYKNPLLFIAADAGVWKNSCLAEPWLITYWLVSWRVLVRDKHDKGIKEMCSTGISFGRSKLLQSCSNLKLKPELEPTVIALKNNPETQHLRQKSLESFQPPYASGKVK